MSDVAFLKLALLPHRGALLAALQRSSFTTSTHLEMQVSGVPGVARIALFAWPEPLGPIKRIAVDVVRLDKKVLRAPVSFSFELAPDERPLVEETPPVEVTVDEVAAPGPAPHTIVGRVTWTEIPAGGLEREVQKLDRAGAPVFAQVDTAVYNYRMTCGCGRVRYSKPNSLHQVHQCRVCTRADRLRKRALLQYKARHGKRR